MGTPSEKKPIDWEGMRPHYEAGVASLRALGKEFGCSDAAIIKHAAKQTPPWVRNLKGKIQAAADAKVSAAVVSAKVGATRKAREAVVVEVNATLQATVRLAHRADVAKARALTMAMLAELRRAGIGKRKLGLVARSLVNARLSEAMRVQFGLERQALGIGDNDPPDPNDADFIERMLNARARAANR
jgi:hypothetical protein